MAIATFYVPDLQDQTDDIQLSDEESKHALRARRLASGAQVRLFDGQGTVASGQLRIQSKTQACVELDSVNVENRPKTNISIASALPKGDRQRVLIDILTQLGIAEFIPLACERSIVKYQDKMLSKWQRYSVEACKQSHNPFIMQFSEPRSIEQVLLNNEHCYFLDQSGEPISSVSMLSTQCPQVTLIIGPEGGFTSDEMSLLKHSCASSLCLSQHILRTEAAAILAAGLIQAMV